MKIVLCALLSALLVGGSVENSVESVSLPVVTTVADTSASSSATLPDDPVVQSILASGIAQKVAMNLASQSTLSVHSSQKVSYAVEPDKATTTEESEKNIRDPRAAIAMLATTSARVDVKSVMTPTSMRATFQSLSSDQPDMILELAVNDGVPMYRETHWYTDQGGYLEGTPYVIKDPSGVDDLQTKHTFFAAIQAQGVPVCALSEFYYTWLGRGSTQIRYFRDAMLSDASKVSKEYRNGEEVFHLVRTRWDDKDASSHGICIDHFWVTQDFKLVAWDSEFTYAQFGSHVSYMVVERAYSYEKEVVAHDDR